MLGVWTSTNLIIILTSINIPPSITTSDCSLNFWFDRRVVPAVKRRAQRSRGVAFWMGLALQTSASCQSFYSFGQEEGRWLDRQSHTRRAVCCQNWCKHICWCADSCPGVADFVEEVALSAARHSLVSLLRCIPYDGFSLLFLRRGVCFLFWCIPLGQLMVVLWHWTQGQAQAIVENNCLLCPPPPQGFTCICLTLNVCTVSELFSSRPTVNVSSFGSGVGINKGIEQSKKKKKKESKTLAWSGLAFCWSPALLRSLRTWLGGFFLNVTCERPGWEVVMAAGSAGESLNRATVAVVSPTTFQEFTACSWSKSVSILHSLLLVGQMQAWCR